jgi:hypothetical protein
MYFIVPTLLIIFISFLIVTAGSIALMIAGMDEKRARFQALSAFTGTGFTTREAEAVVNNPLRRRIVSWLMILGNAGIVTVIVTATSTLVTSHGYQLSINIVILIAGILIIKRIATHKGFTRRWESFIENRFSRSHIFDEGAVEDLLHLLEGYGLVRVIVQEELPFVDTPLFDAKLTEKGILILGIERKKKWIPIPRADEAIQVGDRLIVYGPLSELKPIFQQ